MAVATYTLSFKSTELSISELNISDRITMSRQDTPSYHDQGCLRTILSSGTGPPYEIARTATTTWADLGVPSGKYVTRVRVMSLYQRAEQGLPWVWPNIARMAVVMDWRPDTVWQRKTLEDMLVYPNQQWGSYAERAWHDVKAMAATPVRFDFLFTIDGSQYPYDTYYFDYMVLQIEYTDAPPPPFGDGDDEGDQGGGPGDGEGDTPTGPPGPPPDPWANIPYTQVPNCDAQGFGKAISALRYPQIACAWQSDHIYYLSAGGRTLTFCTLTGAWTDCGYGQVFQPVTIKPESAPEVMFLTPNYEDWQGYVETIRTYVPMRDVLAACKAFTHAGGESRWVRRLVVGPYDGTGEARLRPKRALTFRLWGSITDELGADTNVVGRLTLAADSGWHETHDIVMLKTTDNCSLLPHGLLVEQRFSPAAIGRIFTVDVIFWRSDGRPIQCVTLSQSQLEYTTL